MTQSEFQKDGKLRAKLAEILNDPTFHTAVAVIREAREPRAGLIDRDPVTKAAMFDQRAGMNAFLSDLQGLTQEFKERREPRVKELAKTIKDLPTEQ